MSGAGVWTSDVRRTAAVRTAAPAPGRGTSGSVPGTPPRRVEP